jgi:hypothetical protein
MHGESWACDCKMSFPDLIPGRDGRTTYVRLHSYSMPFCPMCGVKNPESAEEALERRLREEFPNLRRSDGGGITRRDSGQPR